MSVAYLHQQSSSNGVSYSSEHFSLLLLLSHPIELSKTHGHHSVTCLLKIWISRCRAAASFYRLCSLNVISVNSFFLLVGRAKIVLLVTRSHWMSSLTPTSLPAPPITQTCLQRPCSTRSCITCLPARGPWPWLTVATCSSRSSVVHTSTSVPVGTAKQWSRYGLDRHSRSISSKSTLIAYKWVLQHYIGWYFASQTQAEIVTD